ncbi:MAG: maltose alpha-D-glucosyltransferase [Isosphaeraceae bacterium]
MSENLDLWYKDAIIYEVHVRAFFDSVGDGHGDFQGLTQKLDYLQDLGVTAIWLLPFYPSPLKDDGYDIADYTSINPQYGKLDDFRAFLDAAHERGLKVITELVLNHTSDQHPWFQRARRAPGGSPERDFFVWSDTPQKYEEARVIFQDFEPSNWSWDPVAKAYYWHRFYSHQPDLNFDNPAVWEAIFPLVDFWFEMGVDGMRLDAVPYLYEREGTNCENLVETHQFLKALRKHVDSRFPGRMFLAEANQWPEDAVAYFGEGDECHMAFHFPLMPRLFMGLHQEDRFPIQDILAQTPQIPENCQWCLFLRNHDELTLEMVTDEERDYMYRAYTREKDARINLGIRHRLAPLLRNDRRRIELMYALLFSLPGTPVLYYGDEIGMGDNIYLGDRDGVRTPMQWSADRNAGFSKANPQRLYLPVIIDPEYHYETVNVEAQHANSSSLLWWVRRLIAIRKSLRSFSRGTFRLLRPENTKVLAFIREFDGERVLVVANLSRFVQFVQLDLKEYAGCTPQEVLGQTRFPQITEQPYLLTLGPHGFLWFSIPSPPSQAEALGGRTEVGQQDAVSPSDRPLDGWFQHSGQEEIERLLPAYLERNRLIPDRHAISSCEIVRMAPIRVGEIEVWFLIVQIEPRGGMPQRLSLGLTFVPDEELGTLLLPLEKAGFARISTPRPGVICHALAVPACCRALLRGILNTRSRSLGDAEIWSGPIPGAVGSAPAELPEIPLGVSRDVHNNDTVVYGDLYTLKTFSRVELGVNPDLEIGRYLAQQSNVDGIAPVVGAIEYRRRGAEPATLAVLHRHVPSQGTAWRYTVDQLSRYFESVAALPRELAPPQSLPAGPGTGGDETGGLPGREWIGSFLDSANLLGRRTAEFHRAMALGTDPAFSPEPMGKLYLRSLYQSMRNLTGRLCSMLNRMQRQVPEAARPLAERIIADEARILERFHGILDLPLPGRRIRCHGNLHLGQLLFTGKDFVIPDFEGDTTRTIGERRVKRSPLRDVASLIRSLDYAVLSVLLGVSDHKGHSPGVIRPGDRPGLERWAHLWYETVSRTLVKSYVEAAGPSGFLPGTAETIRELLELFLLEQALFQIDSELNDRPDWLEIPLRGALRLLAHDAASPMLQP